MTTQVLDQPSDTDLAPRFDYTQLDDDTARFAWQAAQTIRWRLDGIAQHTVEVGMRLIEVKQRLLNGQWAAWLRCEFGISQSHASKLMRIAHVFGDLDLGEIQTTSTALTLLSITSLPPSKIEQARELLKSGEVVTVARAREFVAETDPVLAEQYANPGYWGKRRREEVTQIISHAAEFQVALRNHQIALAEVYGVPLHPRVGKTLDQMYELIAVIMDTEEERTRKSPKPAQRKSYGKTSRYWGVSWKSGRQRWSVAIYIEGAMKHIGYFKNEEEAARAYDAVARQFHGDKARLNFPEEVNS